MKAYLERIALRTSDLWNAFEGKKVFIAGKGFYGSWFQRYFDYLKTEKGISVSCVSFSARDGWRIESPESYSDSNISADFVINCAGYSGIGTDHDMLWSHGIGPAFLFRDMRQEGAKGLHISTGAIDANSPYARAKKMGELGIGLINRDVQIVRPFATVGPAMDYDSHFAISTFISNEENGETLRVIPTCFRSFVHITDLIVQMLHVLIRGDRKPYQVGSDNVIGMLEAAKVISNNIQIVDETFPSNSNSSFYVADLSRIRDQFGLELEYSSEEAIRDAFLWKKSLGMVDEMKKTGLTSPLEPSTI